MLNNEYCNKVIEEYIEELNGEYYLLKKDKQPGNLFHTPVLIRGTTPNLFSEVDTRLDLNGENAEVFPDNVFNNITYAGCVKDAQIRGKCHVGRILIGYSAMSRSNKHENLKQFLNPFINNAIMDLQEKIIGFYNETPYIGEFFLTFIKNEAGNYFSELSCNAAYELKLYSCCGINPPDLINANTFDKETAKTLWNINL